VIGFAPKIVYSDHMHEAGLRTTTMDQPTLTEYYSAKKRPIEGINPAKRRKLIETESVVTAEVQSKGKSARITRQRSKTTTTPKPTRVLRTRKPRTKNVAKTTENSSLHAFLSLGMKEITEESEKVVSEVTSVNDDHDSEVFASKETPSLENGSTRRRKVLTKNPHNICETPGSEGEIIEKTEKKTISKARTGRRNQKAKILPKEIPSTSRDAQKLQDSEAVESNDDKDKIEGAKDDAISKSGKHQTKPKKSLMVPDKSPVKSVSSGLKINPWIADQANKVLLTRGQAALLLSHQQSAGVQDKHVSRSKMQKPVAEKNGLSKSKAQEGLEKARELIKKMRSLESESSKPKDTSTIDKSERLHKLAKRQSTEEASNSSVR
jgi:hypothetical protein